MWTENEGGKAITQTGDIIYKWTCLLCCGFYTEWECNLFRAATLHQNLYHITLLVFPLLYAIPLCFVVCLASALPFFSIILSCFKVSYEVGIQSGFTTFIDNHERLGSAKRFPVNVNFILNWKCTLTAYSTVFIANVGITMKFAYCIQMAEVILRFDAFSRFGFLRNKNSLSLSSYSKNKTFLFRSFRGDWMQVMLL